MNSNQTDGEGRLSQGGGDYAGGNLDKRRGAFVADDAQSYGPVIGDNRALVTTTYYINSAPPLAPSDRRQRHAMLDKVRRIWIDGLLQHSLYKEALIELNLSAQHGAVTRAHDVLVRHAGQAAQPLPPNSRIVDVYDRFGQALLILGAPGSGKTTLLLELAHDLIQRAKEDESEPIPVIFNLSSWATEPRPLEEWLIDELVKRYEVGRDLARQWVCSNSILPLLDGLDEVAVEQRAACVTTINDFRQENGLFPLVVCSRTADYDTLSTKLRLEGAIAVQSLTREQVRQYLHEVGLRLAPSSTSPLWELLESPLMLHIATMTYATAGTSFPSTGTTEQLRHQLFTAYVEQMLIRRPASPRFTKDAVLHWLSWLAYQMQRHNQTIFYLEHLQPDWLPTGRARWQYVVVDRLGYGLLFGLLAGLLFGLADGWLAGLLVGLFGGQADSAARRDRPLAQRMADTFIGWLVSGLVGWLLFGSGNALIYGLLGGLAGAVSGRPSVRARHVVTVEVLRWSWKQAWGSAVSGLVIGLGAGALNGLLFGVGTGPANGLLLGASSGLSIGLLAAVLGGFTSRSLEEKVRQNQGIRRSAGNAVTYGVVAGLAAGLSYGLVMGLAYGLGGGLLFGLRYGLRYGLLGALVNGGYACLSHFALRFVLWRHDAMPLAYARFLDENTSRILLRAVGGGYIFIHRLLLEYFASLHTEVQPQR